MDMTLFLCASIWVRFDWLDGDIIVSCPCYISRDLQKLFIMFIMG